jgi:hypothetical protein
LKKHSNILLQELALDFFSFPVACQFTYSKIHGSLLKKKKKKGVGEEEEKKSEDRHKFNFPRGR